MTNRKKRRRGLSLLLGGMLLFSAPFQVIAEDEPQPINPTEETPAEATEQPAEVQEPVAVTETPVETAAPEPVTEVPVQTAVPEATVLPETPMPVETAEATSAPVAAVQPEEKAEPSPTPEATEKETVEKAEATVVPAPAATPEVKAAPMPSTAPEPEKEETAAEEEKNPYEGLQKLNAITSDGVSVNVSFEAGTFGEKELPELRVKDVSETEAVASARKALPDQEITEVKSVDISFFASGTEVQPQNGQNVNVQIDLPASLNPKNQQGEYHLVHEHGGTSEVVNTADISSSEATFRTDSFSTFSIIWTSDGRQRAELTVHYVNENRNEINKNQNTVNLTEASGSLNLASYGSNTINNYHYYNAYILENGVERTITDISYQRDLAERYYRYTVRYLNDGEIIEEDTTNNTNGVIRRNVYLKYHTIFSGNHDASVYFLQTPLSNADSNDTKHWSSDAIAVGLGDANVNLEKAVFASDNKNVFKDRNGNGNLSQYINRWPDGSTGSTWKITRQNTKGQWDAITTSVAKEYQEYLQEQLGTNTTVTKNDIESITVIPYKISVNNGNVRVPGGQTEPIHIDSTISIECTKAYHYVFTVDYPSGSGFTDGTVKEGAKAIHVSGSQSSPDAINRSDLPENSTIPQTITDRKGIRYTFDGWYRKADYSGNQASFAYTPSMNEINAGGGTVTFYARYQQATRNISVTKNWNDNDNQDGKRPNQITVQLLANGKDSGKTLTLTSEDNWSGTFENLPLKDSSNQEIPYTIQEIRVSGYTVTSSGNMNDGFTITNTHEPETISIHGTKTWDDDGDRDRKRPESIVIRLHANGAALSDHVQTVTGQGDTWSFEFENLPKYKDGEEINYTITEDRVEDYTTSVNNADYNITNSYTPSEVNVSVTKDWEDSHNQDGIRPNAVTVKLLADGKDTGRTETLNAGTEWTTVFSHLKEYENGRKIAYTVEEMNVPAGYTATLSGDMDQGFVITNTHRPETMKIQGMKIWNDRHNQDGKRPDSITVRLHANGMEVESLPVTDQKSDTWNYEFANLPKYANGQEIEYAVTEDAVENYSAEVDGFRITNSYTPEKTSISVTKDWDDSDNQDGIRPEKVTVLLYANGDKTGKSLELNETNNWSDSFTDLDLYQNGKRIDYTVQEEKAAEGYQSVVSGDAKEGYTITNVHTPDTISVQGTKVWKNNTAHEENRPDFITIRLYANGDPVENQVQTVTGEKTDSQWEFAFEDLPKNENGKEIVYTVTEDHVESYTTSVDQKNFVITNTYNPDQTSISVTKDWQDSDNQDGRRPESIIVQLFADGEKTDKTLELSDKNEWTGIFDNLLEKKDGKKIRYTVAEIPVAGYTTEIIGDEVTGYVITNAYTPERTDIQGAKIWKDQNNQDGVRPSLITIRLYADGEEMQILQINGDASADTWNYVFEDVPVYQNRNPIQYTVKEDSVDGYSSAVSAYKITNTHETQKTSVSVTKKWNDSDNQDGIRPETVTVSLLADGENTGKTVTLSGDNEWKSSFENLDVFRNGKKIIYTVEEKEVTDGYSAAVTGDAETGFIITNSHKPETITVSGKKVWDDDNNRDGKRPESITVRLLDTDNQEVSAIKVSADNEWKWSFANVPKNVNGKTVSYTIREDQTEGYTSEVNGSVSDGFTITNHYTPAVKSISVTKHWEDSDNRDGIRPDHITIVLLANGNRTDQRLILNPDNHWLGTFDHLPVYENGQKITYTVFEETTEGYVAKINGDEKTGFDITNIHNVKKEDRNGSQTSDPGKPSEKKKSSESDKTSDSNGTNGYKETSHATSPKTGDNGDVVKYGILFLTGMMIILVTIITKAGNRKES